MCHTEENKDGFIQNNLFSCQQPQQHIHLKEKKQVLIIKKWKETFTYWKFNDKSLSCFKPQINIIFVLLFCAVKVSFTSNQCFEWMEYW